MRKSSTQLSLVLSGVLLFNFCFWQEKMGLNTLLFAIFYLLALWWIFPEGRASRGFQIMAGGTLLTAALVVWHNSGAAKFAHILSAMCAAGFAQEQALRFVWHAWRQYLWGWWQAPGHFFAALGSESGSGWNRRRRLGRLLRQAMLPLLVASVFYVLYYLANANFAALADGFWLQLGRWFAFDISIPHLFFVGTAFFLIGAAFWRNKTSLAAAEQAAADQLLRTRPQRGRLPEPPLARFGLRQEYRQSLLLLIMLNLLLLLVNATDMRYVWFGFDEVARQNLKSYVHEGTYFLVVSILLAMGVLFRIFRKNLNFFPSNQPLLLAAGVWLAQNAVLAFSVGLRNWRYIDYHGLAYKRIGVALFLLLVFFGLFSLWLKIRRRRTMAWLWRQNAWAFYALLLFNASIGWDVFITRYNLSGRPKGEIDVHYLIYTVSDQNLFLLEKNADLLMQKNKYPFLSENEIQSGIEAKRIGFDNEIQGWSWKSWNAADARNAGN